MTTQKQIDYKIELLKDLTGLRSLNDKWLNDKEHINGKSHRLEVSDLGNYITPRYRSAKEFYYVLDSMVNLLNEAEAKKSTENYDPCDIIEERSPGYFKEDLD